MSSEAPTTARDRLYACEGVSVTISCGAHPAEVVSPAGHLGIQTSGYSKVDLDAILPILHDLPETFDLEFFGPVTDEHLHRLVGLVRGSGRETGQAIPGRVMLQDFTLAGWRTRLVGQGHRVTEPRRPTPTGFTLRPDPDTIITVAVEPDPTLRREYRQRFFVCDPEPEQVFCVVGCPEPLWGRWQELVSRQPPGCWRDFLAGPGSWTLARLARFRAVIFWAEAGLTWEDLDNATHREWGMDVPTQAAPFFAVSSEADSHRPRLVPARDPRFADVVAACFLLASVGLRDCYLADEGGAEVYLAHHHEKVVVFLPAVRARQELVRELADASWLFTDVSGYSSPIDGDGQSDPSAG